MVIAHTHYMLQDINHSRYALTEEGVGYVAAGASPEAQVFGAVPADGGVLLAELKVGGGHQGAGRGKES